ncbi:MAG: efflux RND transporter periplasmic adaptor subunit [Cyclonatronaceae bacterium]
MDRILEKKRFPPKRIAGFASLTLLLVIFVYIYMNSAGESRLNIDTDRVTVSAVSYGPFQEYIPINGTVVPIQTLYLDAIEGGRIDRILVEGGSMVNEGDTLLVLSNSNLQLDVFNREAQILEQIHNLQNRQLSLQQERLRLREMMVEMRYNLQRAARQFEQNKELRDRNMVSDEEFRQAQENFFSTRERMGIVRETFVIDSVQTENQLRFINSSLNRMQTNLEMVQKSMDYLVLKAPISGQLTSLNAEIGESKNRGQRMGQIDVLEGYKVKVGIDEHYIARITLGQRAEFDFAGRTYNLEITRIYPEVNDGRFEVDMEFVEDIAPEGIRRGQTVRLRLELSDIADAVLLARGSFFQKTGGSWVYVLDEEGQTAYRRDVRLGRQNPQFFEVIDGLQPGERVITSSYDIFGENERLVLK